MTCAAEDTSHQCREAQPVVYQADVLVTNLPMKIQSPDYTTAMCTKISQCHHTTTHPNKQSVGL